MDSRIEDINIAVYMNILPIFERISSGFDDSVLTTILQFTVTFRDAANSAD